MESPFPAPGKTIKVKTFLPGAGNEVGNCCSFLSGLGLGLEKSLANLGAVSGDVEHSSSLLAVSVLLVSKNKKVKPETNVVFY